MGTRNLRNRSTNLAAEAALGAGFLAVGVAALVARDAPQTGYEASIYASTPRLTWGLLLGAFLVATAIVAWPTTERATVAASVLGGAAMTTVASLPIVRGYHFMGSADSLTHLGWTKDIATDVIDPHVLFYPGYHSVSYAIGRVTGVELELALLVATVVLFVAFLVFVPLTVKVLTGSTQAMGYAAIATWLVLPINNVATHLMPHTNSLTLFYVPLVLLVLVLYLRGTRRTGSLGRWVSPTGVALGLLSLGLVVLHIQHAVNVLFVFLGICAVQFTYRRWKPLHSIADHRPLYAQTGLLGGLVVAWFLSHEEVARSALVTAEGLFRGDIGGDAEVAQRGGSLVEIGGSLPELFVKMFLVSALVGLVAFGYLLATSRGRFDASEDLRGILGYFALALVPLGVLFAVYFLGTPTMSFRQIGFVYVLLTIIGAIAIWSLAEWSGARVPLGRTAVAGALAVCLVLSLLTVFASPYIFLPTPDVAQQEMTGYGTTLETRAGDVPLATLSSQPFRYGDAQFGTTRSAAMNYTGAGDGLVQPGGFNAGDPIRSYPASTFYIALSTPDVVAEIDVYEELTYRRSGLDALDRDPLTNRVVSNGEFELYLVSNATGA